MALRLSPGQQQLLINAGLTLATGGALLPVLISSLVQFDSLRQRFPRLPKIGNIVGQVRALERRGLQPRISADPFFGDVVISAADQAEFLDELVFERARRRAAKTQDTSATFAARQQLIEDLRSTAVERGFFAQTSDIPPGLRGGVFRSAPSAPLQFVRTA